MPENLHDRFVSARKSIIEREFSSLNPMQRSAVFATEGPVLILAGAGSGKTTVLVNRISNIMRFGRASSSTDVPADIDENDVRLLEDFAADPECADSFDALSLAALDPAPAWSILAITFTKKAAGELQERLHKILGPAASEIWSSTFHAACVRILRRDIDRLGYPNSFTIYDTADSVAVLKDVIKNLELDPEFYVPKKVLGEISRAKDSLLSPPEYARTVGSDFRLNKIADIYREYQSRLKEAGALDFDDIIMQTTRLLLTQTDVREYYQNKFKYILIDEYQDTNNMQYVLTSTLAAKWKNICVVGDDDQSIYKFRGATIENILGFEREYPKARVIRLEQNYRSTGNILSAANSVISNNTKRTGKSLWTDNHPGDPIFLFKAENDESESDFIASKIRSSVKEGARYQDFTVLYRLNAQSSRIEEAFRRSGIPYRIIGGLRFFDRAEVKDMLAYLSVLHNKSDDLRLRRIVNNPTRGIGDKTLEAVAGLAADARCSMFDVLDRVDMYPELSRASRQISAFVSMMHGLMSALETLPLAELYDQLMDKSGYVLSLEAKNDHESKVRLENVRELKSSIIRFESNPDYAGLSGNEKLGAFLDEVALFTDIQQYDENADCVIMMTIHSAKGLEFPVVFIAGNEEGIFPSSMAYDPAELEEERRLCYVAITRAKTNLYMTSANVRMLFGHTTANQVSRFVSEIPAEYVQDLTKRAAPRQATARKQSAVARGPAFTSKPGAAVKIYKKGERVVHASFGPGVVTSSTPMGGDALLEIAFDGGDHKRLMAKSASEFLKPEDAGSA